MTLVQISFTEKKMSVLDQIKIDGIKRNPEKYATKGFQTVIGFSRFARICSGNFINPENWLLA